MINVASVLGISLKAVSGIPKLADSTSLGVWANQSEIVKVSKSEKFPLSKTSKNSQPSSSPCMECGMPGEKPE